jgi:hypothetical protein
VHGKLLRTWKEAVIACVKYLSHYTAGWIEKASK